MLISTATPNYIANLFTFGKGSLVTTSTYMREIMANAIRILDDTELRDYARLVRYERFVE